MTDTTTSFICPCSHIHIFDKYFILTQLWAWLPEITREFKGAGSQALVVRKVDNAINRTVFSSHMYANLTHISCKTELS